MLEQLVEDVQGRVEDVQHRVMDDVPGRVEDLQQRLEDVPGRVGELQHRLQDDVQQRLADVQRVVDKRLGRRQPDRTIWWILAALATAAVVTALVAWFFDPRMGKRRRKELMDGMGGRLRAGQRQAQGAGKQVASTANTLAHRHGSGEAEPSPPANDADLAHRIESVLGREDGLDTSQINVNAEGGIAVLRGTVEDERQIDQVVKRVREVEGVSDVRNLLHLSGTPSPEWQQAVDASQAPSEAVGTSAR
jgi:gas vesicle protein